MRERAEAPGINKKKQIGSWQKNRKTKEKAGRSNSSRNQIKAWGEIGQRYSVSVRTKDTGGTDEEKLEGCR